MREEFLITPSNKCFQNTIFPFQKISRELQASRLTVTTVSYIKTKLKSQIYIRKFFLSKYPPCSIHYFYIVSYTQNVQSLEITFPTFHMGGEMLQRAGRQRRCGTDPTPSSENLSEESPATPLNNDFRQRQVSWLRP